MRVIPFILICMGICLTPFHNGNPEIVGVYGFKDGLFNSREELKIHDDGRFSHHFYNASCDGFFYEDIILGKYEYAPPYLKLKGKEFLKINFNPFHVEERIPFSDSLYATGRYKKSIFKKGEAFLVRHTTKSDTAVIKGVVSSSERVYYEMEWDKKKFLIDIEEDTSRGFVHFANKYNGQKVKKGHEYMALMKECPNCKVDVSPKLPTDYQKYILENPFLIGVTHIDGDTVFLDKGTEHGLLKGMEVYQITPPYPKSHFQLCIIEAAETFSKGYYGPLDQWPLGTVNELSVFSTQYGK